MKLDKLIRIVLGLLIVVAFLVAIGALLFFTQTALTVWDRLLEGPRILRWGYVGGMIGLVALAIYLIWLLLIRRKPAAKKKAAASAPLTREEIEVRLRDAEAAGVDVSEAQRELQELAARQETGVIHLCFFGEISTGKSSLIKALVPGADVEIDVVGGSTGDVRHYRWQSGTGAEILLTDVPGTGGHEEGLDEVALEEARRAHVVLFVCDGDLTRAESQAVGHLLRLDKPLVLVMNKADRYTVEEQAAIMQKLMQRVDDMGGSLQRDRVVAVSAGGEMDVVQRGEGGSERVGRRKRPADIGVLVVAINRMLQGEVQPLDVRRDRAVFRLAAEKLAEAEDRYRAQRSEQIIRNSTRKAVIGSLAAVSPGTDVIIQGYIGTRMTKELCNLYGAAPRDLDVEEFLDLSQSRVGKALPLTLAVAGNGLKAFPGVGTVAGGLVHAVAYGLIFDALGRSLVLTLEQHGRLVPEQAAKNFEEGISEHIEAGVRRVARLALEEKTDAG
jgi:GTP-binding protein EngB required for normal cell division